MATTLYDKIGGEAAVDAAVEEFYIRVIADHKLASFFEGTDMKRLKNHQKKFFTIAFQGIPEGMNVARMLTISHKRLFQDQGLNETHFDLVATHFVGTLEHLQVPQELISEAAGVVLPLRAVFEAGAAEAQEEKKTD